MKKKLTLSNIKNYLEGNTKMLLSKIGIVEDYLQEQYAYRMLQCKDCLVQGTCNFCNCDVPGRMFVNKSCNNGLIFPDIMNKENWERFKEENEIK